MSIYQLNLSGLTKLEVAIARLQEFDTDPLGYYLAFSGGKDSICIYHLAVMAGVKFDAHYSRSGIDPPELVTFIRQYYASIITDKPVMSIWQGVAIHGLPRRNSRWCCELIKEQHGKGRRVLTGIRWQESIKRRQRRLVEICRSDSTKIFVNPIIDWTTSEVWEFIRVYKLPYCRLYDEGFRRLGCVLCPMATARQTQIEIRRFPKIAAAWQRACYRYHDIKTRQGLTSMKRWENPEDMWLWWISRKGEVKISEAQCIMFGN